MTASTSHNDNTMPTTSLAKLLHARTDADLVSCFEAFLVLRPHLTLERFIEQVRRQEAQGYRIVAWLDGSQVVSAAGYRVSEFLAWGKVLYIDDLTTLPSSRQHGHAGALLDWLLDHARAEGCDAVHLDSGHQRHAAHRLYLNKGFVLSSHHFALAL